MQQCYAQRVHFVELLDAAEADLLSQPFQMNTCKVIGVTKMKSLKTLLQENLMYNTTRSLVFSKMKILDIFSKNGQDDHPLFPVGLGFQARLRGLLSSKTATDVTEAISVVVELRLRGAIGDGGMVVVKGCWRMGEFLCILIFDDTLSLYKYGMISRLVSWIGKMIVELL